VRRVGLTGGIGAGKSTVARLFAERGAVVVDSDLLAREVVAPGTDGLAEIVAAFGDAILQPDGSLDRPALGAIVFSDPDALKVLEGITHPRIQAESARLIDAAEAAGAPVLIHDIPLLVESGATENFEDIVVVEAPDEVRLARLEQRGLPRDQALERMKSQATNEQRRAAATYVIDNGGSLDDLRRQIDRVWAALTS
jgi:dephospho-CoA kinase